MLADDGRVVLMDFGTGRELDDQPAGPAAGTPLYLAPELLLGAPASVQERHLQRRRAAAPPADAPVSRHGRVRLTSSGPHTHAANEAPIRLDAGRPAAPAPGRRTRARPGARAPIRERAGHGQRPGRTRAAHVASRAVVRGAWRGCVTRARDVGRGRARRWLRCRRHPYAQCAWRRNGARGRTCDCRACPSRISARSPTATTSPTASPTR